MRIAVSSDMGHVSGVHRLWRSRWRHMLRPAAALFAGVVHVRRALYDRAWLRVHSSALPVVSVGGLEVGGSGKTPVVAHLLRMLLRAGAHPGLLCWGYGRSDRGLVVRAQGAPAHAESIGDEAAMLVASGLDVPVAAAASRRDGARALQSHACTCLVLDDAFSHRALARALDIVVLRDDAPFGNGMLLPAGSLREPPSSLRRAHIVWLHRKDLRPGPAHVSLTWLQAVCPQALVVHSHAVLRGVFDVLGRPQEVRDVPVVVATGVARPQDVYRTILHTGADIRAFRVFADHTRFGPNDAQALRKLMRERGAEALVVTAKDAVKLAPLWGQPQALWAVQTSLSIDSGGQGLENALKKAMSCSETCGP